MRQLARMPIEMLSGSPASTTSSAPRPAMIQAMKTIAATIQASTLAPGFWFCWPAQRNVVPVKRTVDVANRVKIAQPGALEKC